MLIAGKNRTDNVLFATMAMAVILVFAASGCTQENVYRDIQADQPWVGPDKQARAFLSAGTYSLSDTVFWISWLDCEGDKVITGHKAIKKCEQYLKDQGHWEDLRGNRVEVFKQHGHGLPRIPREHLVQPSRRRYSATPTMDPAKELPRPGFEEVLVIVSLDPIVVVQGPGQIQWTSPPGYEDWMPAVGWKGEGKAPAHFLLPHGFAYGTEVPYSEDPQWFSPDLKVDPRSAERVNEDTRQIKVPWGALVLRRKGDIWSVQAVNKE